MADLVAGGAIGVPFIVLYEVIKEAMVKSTMFKPLLVELYSIMNHLEPLVEEVGKYGRELNRRENELKDFKTQMEKGIELIHKCSNPNRLQIYKKYRYSKELLELKNFLQNLLSILSVQQARDVKEKYLVAMKDEMNIMKDSLDELRNIEVKHQTDFEVPELPALTVGFDLPLRELKKKLLKNDKVSMLVLTAPGGCGKTTLATMFCQDEQVKDIFKDNIFFFTVSKMLNFNLIVQRLQQRNATEVPTFQDEATALKWLHKFLEEGQTPMLLVLDDVWPESRSLLEKFDEVKVPNFKILVTSRSHFPGYGSLHRLNYLLDEEDAMNLFRHSASLGDESSNVRWNSLAAKIVKHCKGHPLAIKVVGRSLRGKSFEFWLKSAEQLSQGDSEIEVLLVLHRSLDALDENEALIKECFVDLGSFPEDQKIPVAALIDMWAELYEELDKDFLALEILQKLATRSLADLVVSRNENAEDDGYYSEHFVTQHDLLRELAIYQTKLDPNRKRLDDGYYSEHFVTQHDLLRELAIYQTKLDPNRKRLFIGSSRDNLPKSLTEQKHRPIKPRLVSISSDGMFSTIWHNIELAEVEVLVLNFNRENYALPEFVEKMENLKVLIVRNHGSLPAELSNFHLLDSLPNLKRIRLENVSIPSITKHPIQLKSLKKISLFMCSIGQAFSNCSFQISDAFPYLEEMNIDYSKDLLELPDELCNLIWLKKLSITNCHKLSVLPYEIGGLINLEVLRLRACTNLEILPRSIKHLKKLNVLDIANCVSIVELSEDIGELSSLRKINMRQCSRLQELPLSVWDLKQLEKVICDEDVRGLWEPFLPRLPNVRVVIMKEKFTLDWLQNPTVPVRPAVPERPTIPERQAVPERPPVLEGPPVPVGLDLPLKDLKKFFLKEGKSRLVLIANGGLGKTTLARKFFEDQDVKGIFKKNMFFVVASSKPSLEAIVRELYRQKQEQAVPKKIRDYKVAVQLLEDLLEEAGEDPLLLVLDDVWSPKLLDLFNNFKMPNYKFLVTSRSQFENFGETYPLEPLNREHTMVLFRDLAHLGEKISLLEEVQEKIWKICKGYPLIIKVFATSICKQPMENWQKFVMKMSGASVLDSETEVLICLQRSLDPLDKITRQCFMDLGSFPEDEKISAAALIDMWSELYPELIEDTCIENLYKLRSRSLVDLQVTGKERIQRDGYYTEHFVIQHDVLRQLAIFEARLEPIEQRQRLNITDTSSNLPIGQEKEEEPNSTLQPIKTRLLSISSDGVFSTKWNTVQLPEIEVLLLNIKSSRNYALPQFLERTSRLKVLIVTKYGRDSAELSNFQLLGLLPNLKRIRLETILTPSITKNLTQLKSLEKITLSWCDDIDKAFSSSSIQIPHAFPKLVELNIDNCNDLVKLPAELCDLVSLKKLSVTECYNLVTIPEAIGKLVKLELLRLRRCTELQQLPESLHSLPELNFLDIADCVSMKKLPQNIGALSSLEKLDMRKCSGLEKLPSSVINLRKLREVICDEEKKKLWGRYLDFMENLRKVGPVEF
ncbi:putative powdery mildew resistance protein, RPW8 [Rosa chinensis]|uniref:Putative powdery mildew resistance protein, RPW8 n=1 Tax=Rosa chinensis TaxID=74649 RepID=A0A2P6SAA9_ROSCH|nr:probable disease resistance protein At5g66900 [Rosa chinensis]XP_040367727.1 probable disease resistance protein At5g66900 [Rosa chinensis]XP_040367729.1 probable disease resistance protein At5g66900 [Rosa chinensis]XP_040367731.1 probable disease resistance protein At5g66900 [Rosa chinensis]XP_040367733.1 probable disease resistance protein At5g66900 [Rosa chinensis]PRQ55606.1 putative powdery mildew resistance protein, RPW8 [Rosa chinensis]